VRPAGFGYWTQILPATACSTTLAPDADLGLSWGAGHPLGKVCAGQYTVTKSPKRTKDGGYATRRGAGARPPEQTPRMTGTGGAVGWLCRRVA
jgi:hypothetical protein